MIGTINRNLKIEAQNLVSEQTSSVNLPNQIQNLIKDNLNSCDPFYLVNLSEVNYLYKNWCQQLPGVMPFYAVKCNPDVKVLQRLIKLGAGFDCASVEEMKLMLSLGVDPSKLLFANPQKSPSSLIFAKQNGIEYMTFDCVDELIKIKSINPQVKLIVRIKTDDETSIYPMSIKFGADMQNIPILLEKVIELNLDLVGVSFHVGSGCNDPDVFRKAINDSRQVFDLASDFDMSLQILDIGGGFNNPRLTSSEPNSFESITRVIKDSLSEQFQSLPSVKIIAEPGRYFVSSVSTLVTRVISCRTSSTDPTNSQTAYFINDGIFGSFHVHKVNPLRPNWSLIRPIDDTLYDLSSLPTSPSRIWGPTCAPIDVVAPSIDLPSLKVGDYVIFHHMGAYTSSLTTHFNSFRPASTHYY